MSVNTTDLTPCSTVTGATEAVGNDTGVTVRYTLTVLLAWIKSQIAGIVGFSKQLTTNASGVYTGTVVAGLNYIAQQVSASGIFQLETFSVTGTTVNLTFKQLIVITVVGISVTALAVPSSAVTFNLIGVPVV